MCDDEQATSSLAEAQKFDQRAVAAAACAKAVRQEYGSGLELLAASRMFASIKRASHLVVCTAVASIAATGVPSVEPPVALFEGVEEVLNSAPKKLPIPPPSSFSTSVLEVLDDP